MAQEHDVAMPQAELIEQLHRLRRRVAELEADRGAVQCVDGGADEAAFLKDLLDSTDDVVWAVTTDGRRLSYLSPAAARLYGRPFDELQANPSFWIEAVHAEDHGKAEASVQVLRRRGEATVEYRIVRPDGMVRWVLDRKQAVRSGTGAQVGFGGIATDITELKTAEEALRESELRFRELAGHINEVFWLIDCRTRAVLYVSPVYETLWGASCQSVCDDPNSWTQSVFSADCQRVATAYVRKATSGDYDEEYRLVQPHGKHRWVRDRAFPIRDSDGKVYRIARITEDITLRRDAEEQQQRHHNELVHVARLSTMGEMMAGIAHEINQPLYAITNFSDACRATLADQNTAGLDKIRKWTDQIARQAERAGQIINRLGTFVRKADPHRSTVDLNDLIREAVEFVAVEARQNQIKVFLDLIEPPPLAVVDRVQIQQVLVNLLQNAFDAISSMEGVTGTVTIRCEIDRCDDTARISVEDNGPGFTVDSSQLFDTFFTTKADGMGMGLAISRSIVGEHGGSLWAKAGSERGSVFLFTLSLANPRVAHAD